MSDIANRLRNALAGIEGLDREMRDELETVRSGKAADTVRELVGRLESRAGFADFASEALETIVLRRGRPVLTVTNDDLDLTVRDTESDVWRVRLSQARARVLPALRAVGRIEVTNHPLDWLGTGWLVDEHIVVTNRHVAREFGVRRGEEIVFRGGLDGIAMTSTIDLLREAGRTETRPLVVRRIVHVEDDAGPDVALLEVEPSGGGALPAPIVLATRQPVERDHVAVIGYPAKDSRIPDFALMAEIFGDVFDCKRLAPGLVRAVRDGVLLHDCSTLGGNSGSVVLDLASGTAAGLHFSGRFLEANYAVAAAEIGRVLTAAKNRPRRDFVAVPPKVVVLPDSAVSPRPDPTGASGAHRISVTIPIRVDVVVGAPERVGPSLLVAPSLADVPAPIAEAFEEMRPADYADRKGFDTRFLGDGLEVALPKVLTDGDVLSFVVDGKKERVLKYEHFSVVMSKRRRMCWYSAVNIDGSRTQKVDRGPWRLDPRIPREAQIRDECYGNAPKFSRGHMTRREDPVWGTLTVAERGNADSMHVTNTVPQVQSFNAGLWLELENYALRNARKDDMRISVFTGPFLRPDDPTDYGVVIPRAFWKVIAFAHDKTGRLCATGYRISQEQALGGTEFVFGQFETHQVSLGEIERDSGVSFGGLRAYDALDAQEEGRPRALQELRDIRFLGGTTGPRRYTFPELDSALDTFDWSSAHAYCVQVTRRLDANGDALAAAEVAALLSRLRRKRRFEDMELVANAYARAGGCDAKVGTLHAQALIDQSKLSAADTRLRELEARTNLSEHACSEILGLLGRVHKQFYVDAPPAMSRADRVQHMQMALEWYRKGYEEISQKPLWHAINLVALYSRARRDKLEQDGLTIPDERPLAQAILARLGGDDPGVDPPWLEATALEAHVALGRFDEALAAARTYLAHKDTDAFENASTLRQLREVWGLSADGGSPVAAAGGPLGPVAGQRPSDVLLMHELEAALLRRVGGEVLLSAASFQSGRVTILQANFDDERIIPLKWFHNAIRRCASIACVQDAKGARRGTGFLVQASDFPGLPATGTVLLTNWHVVSEGAEHRLSIDVAAAEALFEATQECIPAKRIVGFSKKHDACFIELEKQPDAGLPLKPAPNRRTPNDRARVYVIGHPNGAGLGISLHDSYLLAQDEERLHYRTPTHPGSSGSPVFDEDYWTLIGLHHSTNPNMARLNGEPGTYEANEGYLITAIQRAIKKSPRS